MYLLGRVGSSYYVLVDFYLYNSGLVDRDFVAYLARMIVTIRMLIRRDLEIKPAARYEIDSLMV